MLLQSYTKNIFRTECNPGFEILKLLLKTNCKKCGQPTCMVFAAQAAEGGRGAEDCPELAPENEKKLDTYLAGFRFE